VARVCTQCGRRPPIYNIENTHLLCLDCYERLQQVEQAKLEQNFRFMNYLGELMDSSIGMPGFSPRIQLPAPPVIRSGDMNFQNVTVNDSVVGAVNNGEIDKLDVAISKVRQGGNAKLAGLVQKMTQAIVDSQDLTPAQKAEALELLGFLGEQAAKPRAQRQRLLAKAAADGLERILGFSAALATIWSTVGPHLHILF
jgi:hypothetical protein